MILYKKGTEANVPASQVGAFLGQGWSPDKPEKIEAPELAVMDTLEDVEIPVKKKPGRPPKASI